MEETPWLRVSHLVTLEGSFLKSEHACMLIPSNLCRPSPCVFIIPWVTFRAEVGLRVGTELGTRKWNDVPGLYRKLVVQLLEGHAGPAFLTLSQAQVKNKNKTEGFNVGPGCQP